MAQTKVQQPKAVARGSEGNSTTALLRLAGYGLLILGAFDVVLSFVPLQFTNPQWEFQLVGSLVERGAVPLLGLVLVLYGEREGRIRPERLVLPVLSWAALLAGIAYLTLIPLGVVNSRKIDQQNSNQITQQVNQRMGGIQQAREQLKKASSTQLNAAFALAKQRTQLPADVKTPLDLKKKATENIADLEQRLGTQSEQAQANVRLNLLKSAAKWNLGALVLGVLFILIWRTSRWARRRTA